MIRKQRWWAGSAAAMIALAACGGDVVGPDDGPEGRVAFTFADGQEYEARGAPTFEGGDVSAGAFATAFPDSVGGLVITSFRPGDGTRGDLFILQLVVASEGERGPCGTGGDCHGRLLENIDADDLHDLTTAWEIVAGTVTVDELTPIRVRGSFADLVLRAQDGGEPDLTVDGGTFDLPLLSSEEGVDAMRCFLTRATGGTCS